MKKKFEAVQIGTATYEAHSYINNNDEPVLGFLVRPKPGKAGTFHTLSAINGLAEAIMSDEIQERFTDLMNDAADVIAQGGKVEWGGYEITDSDEVDSPDEDLKPTKKKVKNKKKDKKKKNKKNKKKEDKSVFSRPSGTTGERQEQDDSSKAIGFGATQPDSVPDKNDISMQSTKPTINGIMKDLGL
jgi:hypothetical protein